MSARQENLVTYRLVGGRTSPITVLSDPEPDGGKLIEYVKGVLAVDHHCRPEQIAVLSIAPRVAGAVPYDAHLAAAAKATVPQAPALPSADEIGRMNKGQCLAVATDLLSAYPELTIETDGPVPQIRASLVSAVREITARQAQQRTLDDANLAASQG